MSDDADVEALMKELDAICVRLENHRLPLDDSLALYERGVTIHDQIKKELESAKRRLVEIVRSDGSVADFDQKNKQKR